MNWDKPLWKGFLRDEDGSPSLPKLGSYTALLAAILWVTVSLAIHKVIPDLTEPAEWVGGITLSFYGVHQTGLTIRHALGKPDSDPQKPSEKE